MAERGLKKQRSQNAYNNKVKKITKWYNHILKNRQEKNQLGQDKKPLKNLDDCLDPEKIKKPLGV